MINKVEGICQYEGCEKLATAIAKGRIHPIINCYCDSHAVTVAEEDDANEYQVDCPNCGCMFGV